MTVQDAAPGKGMSEIKWEYHPLNVGSPNFIQEIERTLKDNELLISEWSPIHLSNMLCNWFWTNGVQDVSGGVNPHKFGGNKWRWNLASTRAAGGDETGATKAPGE